MAENIISKIKIKDIDYDLRAIKAMQDNDGNVISSTYATKEYVEALYKKLNSNTVLGFYCIEDVTIVINGISKVYPANSNVEISFIEGDVFEIIPTSNNSILTLTAFPSALGTYYPWLEGVKQFSNILFDMNDEAMYSKWNQGNQGAYQVQYAQYLNCIFWSDNPYISELSKRTNYTLYYTSQLPLCYSTIPDNTFKAFYLAFNVTSDPNWGNPIYRESFAKANWATQVFSYYGARSIGIFGHDDPDFNITLPKDCRGLMSGATAIENAGTFDAINTTDFGAKSGSWRDAFGYCSSLKNLYIKNLKVNLNVSWSPLNYDSIYFIISEATNTNAITISVSPYTYNLLSQSDFDLAASKNITIELLTANYVEDKRLSAIADKANKTEVLLKTEQELTDTELAQVRNNLKFIGKDVAGKTFTIDGVSIVASENAEIFGDYENNIATGQWSIAEGSGTIAKGRASHAEGAYSKALQDGSHVEGYQTEATGYWSHAEGEMTKVTSYASHAEGSYCTMPDGSKRYTTASGYASHAEGGGTLTSGSCSHAEGLATVASGNQAHVEGRYTIAAGGAQHVEGVANIEDTSEAYIHIAGNGTLEARSNAHTLDWDGNAWYAGDVYVGSTSGTNKDEGSKKLATESYVNEQTLTLKNELLNGAGEAYDTLKELGDLINDNTDALGALEAVATNKQDKLTGAIGQIVGFDENGNPIVCDSESYNLTASFIVEKNKNTKQQFWYGTQAEYDAIVEKNNETVYIVSEDEEDNFIASDITYNNNISNLNANNVQSAIDDIVCNVIQNFVTVEEMNAAIQAAIQAAFANIARAEESEF